MLRVGLTGGLATGKSFVGAVLEELGCRVLKADELGHAVLEPGGEPTHRSSKVSDARFSTTLAALTGSGWQRSFSTTPVSCSC